MRPRPTFMLALQRGELRTLFSHHPHVRRLGLHKLSFENGRRRAMFDPPFYSGVSGRPTSAPAVPAKRRRRQKGDYVLRNLFAMSDKSPDRSIRNRQRRAAQ